MISGRMPVSVCPWYSTVWQRPAVPLRGLDLPLGIPSTTHIRTPSIDESGWHDKKDPDRQSKDPGIYKRTDELSAGARAIKIYEGTTVTCIALLTRPCHCQRPHSSVLCEYEPGPFFFSSSAFTLSRLSLGEFTLAPDSLERGWIIQSYLFSLSIHQLFLV